MISNNIKNGSAACPFTTSARYLLRGFDLHRGGLDDAVEGERHLIVAYGSSEIATGLETVFGL